VSDAAPCYTAPVVSAGDDASVTLPDALSLTGSVSDDALPAPPGAVALTWSETSGPGDVTFADPTAGATTATFSAAGEYVLRLTGDDGALQGFDELTVTVADAAPANTAPVVTAGDDASVTLPDGLSLAGSVTDDGQPAPPGAVALTWSETSGPGDVTFADPTAGATTATFSAPGEYVLRLTADDGALQGFDELTVTVSDAAPANTAPVVTAGDDASVTLPDGLSLVGSVTDDAQPAPPGAVALTWSKTAGLGDVTFADPSAAATTATFSAAGTYVLRLTGDDGALQGFDELTVTVADGGPTVAAAVDVAVRASADDAEERTTTGAVTLTSGDLNLGLDAGRPHLVGMRFSASGIPAGATVTGAYVQFQVDEVTTAATSVTVVGEAADDSAAFTATARDVSSRARTTATVPWNLPGWPTVAARGVDQRTPDLTAVVQEIVSRPGWAGGAVTLFVSGTGERVAESFDGGAAKAPVLHVEYTTGSTGPANAAPVVSAGDDASVTLPDAVSLTGSVSDDALPVPPGAVALAWSESSGPGDVTFADPSAAATTATFSAPGEYVLRLTGDDGALQGFDELTVTVSGAAPANTAPVVSAGDDASVTLPDALSLTGSVTDDAQPAPPGAVALTWSETSGPGDVAFADPSAAATTATFSAPGEYVLRLTGDDGSLQGFDELTVTVADAAPGNTAPVVTAGDDASVTLPDGLSLAGSVTDDALPAPPGAVALTWSKTGGLGDVTFADPHAAATTATFSAAGTYVLRLTGDDGALQGFDELTVTVADAGPLVAAAVDVAVRASADDAEERTTTGAVTLTSGDLNLGLDAGRPHQVGMRFSASGIPAGATVTRAYVQFQADEVTTAATSVTVVGEAADDSAAFTATARDVSSRARTTATVPWNLPGWPTVAARGVDQRTPDLSAVVQEIVSRPGWAGGAVTLFVTGTGERVAESFDGGAAKAPVLHVEYTTGSTGPAGPANTAPVVSAGDDASVTLPDGLSLAGSAIDDGLPTPPGAVALTWSETSGPGDVTFADPTAGATTATFSAPGEYVLRLTGDDGALQGFDELTVTVSDAAPANTAPVVSAGDDAAVTLPDGLSLTGSVTDDALPAPPGAVALTWSKTSGPGDVTFADPTAGATTATFSAPGEYVLRLTGDDGALQAFDELTVTVSEAP
jgi:hypothetical protein